MFQTRKLFIENISKFTDSSKDKLDSVLAEFGWSSKSLYSSSQKEPHISLSTKNDSHIGSPSKDENICFNNTTMQIDLSQGLNNVTVGSNPLYKELVDSISKPAKEMKDEKSKTEALIELLKMERDAKRRRINYKNRVHTKNKSHIEIMREVLAEQMSTLTQQAEDEKSSSVKDEELRKPSEELIEIKFPNGNPYLAWKYVLDRNNSSDDIEKEYQACGAQGRYKYSDHSKFRDFDHREERKDRDLNYDEKRSKSKYSSSRFNDRKSDLKYTSSSHELGGSENASHKNKHRDDKYPLLDYRHKKDKHSYRNEEDIKYSDNKIHKRKSRHNSDPDISQKKYSDVYDYEVGDIKHKLRDDTDNSFDRIRKRDDYEYYKDIKYSGSEKHKRRRSDYRDSSSDSSGKRDNEYFEDHKYSEKEKNKRNHSSSKSQSKHHSKQHKSKHKNH